MPYLLHDNRSNPWSPEFAVDPATYVRHAVVRFGGEGLLADRGGPFLAVRVEGCATDAPSIEVYPLTEGAKRLLDGPNVDFRDGAALETLHEALDATRKRLYAVAGAALGVPDGAKWHCRVPNHGDHLIHAGAWLDRLVLKGLATEKEHAEITAALVGLGRRPSAWLACWTFRNGTQRHTDIGYAATAGEALQRMLRCWMPTIDIGQDRLHLFLVEASGSVVDLEIIDEAGEVQWSLQDDGLDACPHMRREYEVDGLLTIGYRIDGQRTSTVSVSPSIWRAALRLKGNDKAARAWIAEIARATPSKRIVMTGPAEKESGASRSRHVASVIVETLLERLDALEHQPAA
ncbi:hypothetical protein CRT60_01095 [Azospirillum palustre]|uniref:Uncharacterized protein n=1 Tax=Azospirillum palustre TaxID=2044885 RepID=A0A2B8BNY0_9PROT|nr:hypothetical protein [Azospirillum palustre]PGH59258.1 hypothetical protein CRT60_01095 [Azospirillum palustre]